MIWFITIVIIMFSIEIVLNILIRSISNNFQWIITEKSEYPILDPKGLESFFNKSYDPILGWTRKKLTSGMEIGANGEIEFQIDELGSRINSSYKNFEPTIACFGDSYSFCRQVENDETWEYFLGDKIKTGVLNYGVGNYGFDQALLRYSNTDLPKTIKTIIMAVVPETICRIQSFWKHYLEFGNTFAFKPMFKLESENIKLYENPMQSLSDFYCYNEKLDYIKSHDRFYSEKFKKYKFRFPYTYRFIKNYNRNYHLLRLLFHDYFSGLIKDEKEKLNEDAFTYIMLENIKHSHTLYSDTYSKKLFARLIQKFVDETNSRGHNHLFVIIPQLIDVLVIGGGNDSPYGNFFKKLNSDNIHILDTTPFFVENIENIKAYYVNDKYGGHPSKLGNKMISELISHKLDLSLA